MALKHEPAHPCGTREGMTVRQVFVKDIAAQLASETGDLDISYSDEDLKRNAAIMARRACIIADAVIREELRTASTRLVMDPPVTPATLPVVDADDLVRFELAIEDDGTPE